MQNNVSILLATYNGANYLKQLLDSIVNQTYVNWNLYIHDDMSEDSTQNIIKQYTHKYNNIFYLNDIKRRGAPLSFLWLLDKVDSEYYMFCDQDDIWLPNKILNAIESVKSIETKYRGKPIIVFSDLIVVDSNLKTINNSFFEYASLSNYVGKTKYLPVLNYITGCTMAFNKKVKEISFPISKNIIMHDSWLSLRVYKKKGIIECIKNSDILYRQHNHNVVGAVKSQSIIPKFIKLKQTIINNIKYYLMVKDATNISLFRYILLKFQVIIHNVF